MTAPTHDQAENLHRAIYNMARSRTFDGYAEAIRRGIIDQTQADLLILLWDERHPYEPLTPNPCPARSPESDLPCRLVTGHEGTHEATVDDTVTAVWSDETWG